MQNQTSGGRLLHDFRAVLHDGEELLRAGTQDLDERAKAARTRLKAALAAARDSIAKLEKHSLQSAKAANMIVHQHPYPIIAVSFGIGLVLGYLLDGKLE